MGKLRLPRLLRPRGGLHRGMARAGGGPAPAAGHRPAPGDRRRNAPGVNGVMHLRRRFLARLLALPLAFLFVAAAQAQVLSSRIWPARDYTRITIESKEEIKYSVFGIKDPERLVLDLEVGEVSAALNDLGAKVAA